MLYKTHITTWYTVASTLSLLTGVYNPLIFIAVPLFSLLADADHNKGMVAQTLWLKFWFLWHRGILHSWFWLLILNIIFYSLFILLIKILWFHMQWFFNIDNVLGINLAWHNILWILSFLVIWLFIVLLAWWIIYNIIGKFLWMILWKKISNFILNFVSFILFLWSFIWLWFLYKESATMPFLNVFIWFYILLLSHLAGDYFTNTWFPFFYPFSKRRIKAPLTFSTGKSVENIVLVVLTIINIYLLTRIIHSVDGYNSLIVHISTPILLLSILIFSIIFIMIFWSNLNVLKQIKNISKNLKWIIKSLLWVILWIIIFTVWIFWMSYAYVSTGIHGTIPLLVIATISLIMIYMFLHFTYKKFIKTYSYIYFISISVLFIYIILYSFVWIMINGFN